MFLLVSIVYNAFATSIGLGFEVALSKCKLLKAISLIHDLLELQKGIRIMYGRISSKELDRGRIELN